MQETKIQLENLKKLGPKIYISIFSTLYFSNFTAGEIVEVDG